MRGKTWTIRLSRLGLALLAGAALILLTLLPAFAQEAKKAEPQKPWTGKLADGRMITMADLDQILQAHALWLQSEGKEGKQANLSEANLKKADLSRANLEKANISHSNLCEANLRGAKLNYADLSRAYLDRAVLIEAKLVPTNLSQAYLYLADLSRASLFDANLSRARLINANLSEVNLLGANLSGAQLSGTNLSGAQLSGTNLSGAIFEPKPGTVSDFSFLCGIRGLSSLRYEYEPSGLLELREAFKKAGTREPEREVNYALNHNRRVKLWEIGYFKDKLEYDQNQDFKSKLEKLMAKVESLFHLICFEVTCGYGLYPGRPLKIMGLGLPFFTVPYLLALGARKPETGLWVVLLPDRVLDKNIKDKPVKLTFENPFLPPAEGRGIRFRSALPRFLRVLWVGLQFSLISAFSLGWRELNVGNWITRIQRREYTLRATGWVRSVAGIQSLLSIYLLALWVLSYFGRPFD